MEQETKVSIDTILSYLFGIFIAVAVIITIPLIGLRFFQIAGKILRDSYPAKNNTICYSDKYVLEDIAMDIRNAIPNTVRVSPDGHAIEFAKGSLKRNRNIVVYYYKKGVIFKNTVPLSKSKSNWNSIKSGGQPLINHIKSVKFMIVGGLMPGVTFDITTRYRNYTYLITLQPYSHKDTK